MRYASFRHDFSTNLGDQVQTLAVEQHLPRIDTRVNRDSLREFSADQPRHVGRLVTATATDATQSRLWSSMILTISTSVPSARDLCVMSDCQVSLGSSASNRVKLDRGRFFGCGVTKPRRLSTRQIELTEERSHRDPALPHPLTGALRLKDGRWVEDRRLEQRLAELSDRSVVPGALQPTANTSVTRLRRRVTAASRRIARRIRPSGRSHR